MQLNNRKAMPHDSVEALAALEQIVGAEEAMRAGKNEAGCDLTDILRKTVSGGSEYARGAVASQLAGTVLLHSQSDYFAQKEQLSQQVEQLCQQRLQGLCVDAAALGKAYATASESSSDAASREDLLDSLTELQQKMTQTEALVWKVQGESGGNIDRRKRVSVSAVTCSFLCELAVYNPVSGAALLPDFQKKLIKTDMDTVLDILQRSACDRAYHALSDQIVSDAPEERAKELCEHCRENSPETLQISPASYALLQERIEVERMQVEQLHTVLAAIKRKNTARSFCESLAQGDRVQAVATLGESKVFSDAERRELSKTIRQQQWSTEPAFFIQIFADVVAQERAAHPYCVFPSASLAPYDAVLLYELLGEYSPKNQFENERLVSLWELYSERFSDKKHVSFFQRKQKTYERVGISGKVSAMTLLRYIADSVIAARKNSCSVDDIIQSFENNMTL
ncbi:hypothetical protein [Halodesulfovibrio sp.]|jgi:hypothetical protein|uniref:hypothetical protein n=1 Tax=Halodesulfovibrio sp. TaxID=1912772 RepID=UPI0025E6C1FA|nr:hypothetical protein [Halodesulfovibrio sp.]MCT4536297.1 hypothetical protein [Halodesulfovibrio sp.]